MGSRVRSPMDLREHEGSSDKSLLRGPSYTESIRGFPAMHGECLCAVRYSDVRARPPGEVKGVGFSRFVKRRREVQTVLY